MNTTLKQILVSTALPLLVASGTALAQTGKTFLTKPLNVIIAGGTGTTLDTTVRMFTAAITKQTGHQIVIDYKGGAGGMSSTMPMPSTWP